MKKFKELVILCNGSVEISVNDHKDSYQSVEQYIDYDEILNIEKEVFEKMIETNTIVRVQAYIYNPNSFLIVYHYDIDKALDIALLQINVKKC